MGLPKLPTAINTKGVDDINQRRRRIETLNGVLDFTFDDSRVKTRQEVAADIEPVNKAYRELDVKRYGAVGDGVTDDTPAFNRAAQVARITGGAILVSKPPVQYLLTSPWNLTNGNTTDPQFGFIIRGEAAAYDNDTSAHILIRHTGHALDCAGTSSVRLRDLVIATDATTFPDVGVFLARNSIGNSQFFKAQNVTIIGKFSEAVLYNYGTETGVTIGCTFYNNADTDACVEYITSHNILGLTSTFITIATGEQSTICHRHYGCDYFMNSTNSGADCVKLDNANHVYYKDCFMDCRGRSFIFVDPTNGGTAFAHIDGIDGENSSPVPTYGICFGAASGATTHLGWQIENSFFPSTTRAIFAGANVTLDNHHIRNILEASSKGFEAVTVQGSTIDSNSLALQITNSKWNLLVGQTDSWAIGFRTNDNWVDTRLSNTWTPDTSAMTITGAKTVTDAKLTRNGPLVTLTTTLSAATSIVCANGTGFGGMPAGSANSAIVIVMNKTTNVLIGIGLFNGTLITLPAINVGANVQITISAIYFAA